MVVVKILSEHLNTLPGIGHHLPCACLPPFQRFKGSTPIWILILFSSQDYTAVSPGSGHWRGVPCA